VPRPARFAEACAEIAQDPDAHVLAGGEDYELLFTVPRGRTPQFGTCIGRAAEAPGITVRDAFGRAIEPPQAPGFDHFGGSRGAT
jgi:thiamine monophosphate kinase